MTTVDVDVVVIGAGVVGLAIARELARAGREPFVLEREIGPGRGVSGRNSGVVHVGLHHEERTLVSRLVVEGRERLFRYCESHGVAHRRTGKLIVAADDAELPALELLAARARDRGAGEVEWLDRAALASREPLLTGAGALRLGAAGLVDAGALMLTLAGETRRAGASIAYRTDVRAIDPGERGCLVEASGDGGERVRLLARHVVNAAGLGAPALATRAGVDLAAHGLSPRWIKGDYFVLADGAALPRTAIVYPVPRPDDAGLGVHLTTDLRGTTRVGPDATVVDRPSYVVDAAKAPAFVAAVSRYFPGVRTCRLVPDFAGVRPRIERRDGPRDFVVHVDPTSPRVTHLLGIESPGLTASLALGAFVAGEVARTLE